ncbi:Isochorismate synthase [Planktothrix serta PCC 8927]|uniref:isochorismate synthase n=1 Tax=Planktothrix serta PCC 8927 TaxID=671068 RepID=A0A7Z9BRB3_9CYAN|nr:isochorismate synthase [Planktothrix serta]VXD21078.1 Isochorismate synthase [Planktothrix serta PCC 8927]
MPVFPSATPLLQDRQELHRFLLEFQHHGLQDYQTKILSIAHEIQWIDPLAVLQEFYHPNLIHFYFEKPQLEESFVAVDTALKFTTTGKDRFLEAQNFIQSCLDKTVIIGSKNSNLPKPYFCCSFTFFDQHFNSNLSLHQEAVHFPPTTIFLPKWQVIRKKNRCILIVNIVLKKNSKIENILSDVWYKSQQINALEKTSILSVACEIPSLLLTKQVETDPKPYLQFKQSVHSALDLIQAKSLKKLVLSQPIDVVSKKPFNLINSLNNLRFLYPDCYIFSTANGKGQQFIGASPERLISLKNQELITDALAGSAPRGKTPLEDINLGQELLNSEKNLREHQVVVDFIVERLLSLGLTPNLTSLPRLRQLTNIQHLWTPIQCQVSANIHLLEILAQLHPTPAVAGTPRDIAQQQIHHYETFDRSLYAAPIGWIDHQGNGEFVVGIRSALLDGNRARLYAGAGIVAGSEPEKELAEIQLKLQALLRALV